MAPKRHGGPVQSAGRGYVKSDRPDERRAFGGAGCESGGAEAPVSEPPADVPFEEAPDLPQQRTSDAPVSTAADSLPEPEPTPELEPAPEAAPEANATEPVAADILPSAVPAIPEAVVPASMEAAAPTPLDDAVSASASLIGSVAGGLGLAALIGGGWVVIGLGAALGAWHSVALANNYLGRR